MPLEILVPFHVGEDGKVDTTSNPDVQIRQHVFSLVNTTPTERVMIPTYGVDAMSLIFEDMDSDEIGLIVSGMVRESFASWEPGVELVSVTPDDSLGRNISQIDVQYRRRDSADSLQAANVNNAIIGSDGTVKEIVRG